jgi:hypothetical protein
MESAPSSKQISSILYAKTALFSVLYIAALLVMGWQGRGKLRR